MKKTTLTLSFAAATVLVTFFAAPAIFSENDADTAGTMMAALVPAVLIEAGVETVTSVRAHTARRGLANRNAPAWVSVTGETDDVAPPVHGTSNEVALALQVEDGVWQPFRWNRPTRVSQTPMYQKAVTRVFKGR